MRGVCLCGGGVYACVCVCVCVCVSLCLKIRALEQRIKRSASHNKAEKKERQMDRLRDV